MRGTLHVLHVLRYAQRKRPSSPARTASDHETPACNIVVTQVRLTCVMAATEPVRERSRERPRNRSKERSKKRDRSRSRDRDSKRSKHTVVPENGTRRTHRSRSRERERSRRDHSPDRSRPLDFAARQAARGDRDDKGTGKSERDPARSKHSRSDSRDLKPSRPSREQDAGDRHRRESDRDRPHENGRARSRDRLTDRKSLEPVQADLPGPPSEDGTTAVNVKKAEPLSLEELLRKKQEEQAELAKVRIAQANKV